MSTEHHDPHRGHHTHRTVERRCDVAVVGGSAAGLAAALQLGRQRRSVIVIDAGEPRNAPAEHMHSFLGSDGTPPAELTRRGREEVRSYGGEVLDGRVVGTTRTDSGHFRLELVGGHAVIARRVLVAVGLVDELPEIDGLAQHWGGGVIHCPFCHGYEVRDQRIVQIVTHPMGLHPTVLWAQLTAELTVVLHGGVEVDDAPLHALRSRGVEIVTGRVRRVVTGGDGRIAAVEVDGGRAAIPADAVAVGTRVRVAVEPFAGLGLQTAPHVSGAGEHIEVDGTGQTMVPGVYAAGNAADPSHQVLQAAADGARTGAMISFDLAREDMAGDVRVAANRADWDGRYEGQQLWSGNPNGALVQECTGLAPGRALDVGAGEGGDAIWLAERGWSVTANDISQRALDRAAAEAARRGVGLACLQEDANAPDAFEPETFDLVTAMYASIPRSPDGRGVRNLVGAVAPGGTLLVVSHDLAPMRGTIDTTIQSRAFDPDAYVRVDDVAARLAGDGGWEIEVHELRPRPKGSATDALHVHDVVLRARRAALGAS